MKISPRRRQIVELIALGRTNEQIAAIMKISRKTVEKQRTTCYQKYKLRCSADVARFALAHKLIRNDFEAPNLPDKKTVFITHTETDISNKGLFEIGTIDTPYEILTMLFGQPLGFGLDCREWLILLFNGARISIQGYAMRDRNWVVSSDYDSPNSYAILRGILTEPMGIAHMRMKNRAAALQGRIASLANELCDVTEELDGMTKSMEYHNKKFIENIHV